MSGTAGGLLTSVVTLSLLEAIVSSRASAGRVGTLLTGVGTVVTRLSSPAIAAIPNRANYTGAAAAAPASTGATAPPAAAAQTPRLPAPSNPSITA